MRLFSGGFAAEWVLISRIFEGLCLSSAKLEKRHIISLTSLKLQLRRFFYAEYSKTNIEIIFINCAWQFVADRCMGGDSCVTGVYISLNWLFGNRISYQQFDIGDSIRRTCRCIWKKKYAVRQQHYEDDRQHHYDIFRQFIYGVYIYDVPGGKLQFFIGVRGGLGI